MSPGGFLLGHLLPESRAVCLTTNFEHFLQDSRDVLLFV